MEFRRRRAKSSGPPTRVALVPGSFNPPTNAHQALLEAALDHVDEVIALLPRVFPHKSYDGASLEDRVQMLDQLSPYPYSIAISDGGLFLDMCAEFQHAAGPAEVYMVCGRDAAERIITWRYEDPETLARMFTSFHLLVASRQGEFDPPPLLRDRIHRLSIDLLHDGASSTEVRERIQAGEAWRHLVPERVAPLVERFYQTSRRYPGSNV